MEERRAKAGESGCPDVGMVRVQMCSLEDGTDWYKGGRLGDEAPLYSLKEGDKSVP